MVITKADKLLQKIASVETINTPRMHIGASVIGGSCTREAWYHFRWAAYPQFDARMHRLFATGDEAEFEFEAMLKAAGCTVLTVDKKTGNQFRFASHCGHFGGSLDGIIYGVPDMPDRWLLLEFKTHNDRSFKDLVKKGVAQSKPKHYAQMQVYMGKMLLKGALYCAKNKNDEHLHFEIVEFNQARFNELDAKADVAINSEKPPAKLSTSASWYECKFCDYHSVCHMNKPPERNCRTCKNLQMLDEGKWQCHLTEKPLDKKQQLQGCDEYKLCESFNDSSKENEGSENRFPPFPNLG